MMRAARAARSQTAAISTTCRRLTSVPNGGVRFVRYRTENAPTPGAFSNLPFLEPHLKAVPTVYTRTLARAAEIVGGEEELARILRVVPRRLSLWVRGVVAPPGDVFLIAADIVSEHGVQELSTERQRAPQVSNL